MKLRIGFENSLQYKKIAKSFFDKELVLMEDAFLQFEIFLQQAYKLHPGFRCYEDALEFIVHERNKKQRQQLVSDKHVGLLKGISNSRLFP